MMKKILLDTGPLVAFINNRENSHDWAVNEWKKIKPPFLSWNYEKIRILGHGANQKNLNSMFIKSIAIPLPIFSEQKDIAITLKACDRKIQALEKEIALTDELFHAMLEQLMTGKISTQPLTETYV